MFFAICASNLGQTEFRFHIEAVQSVFLGHTKNQLASCVFIKVSHHGEGLFDQLLLEVENLKYLLVLEAKARTASLREQAMAPIHPMVVVALVIQVL